LNIADSKPTQPLPKEQLFELLQKDAFKEIALYTVPIVIDNIPHGTGTLAQYGDVFGIITAEHCVNDPDDSDLRLVGPKVKAREFRTSLGGNRVARVLFEVNHLRIIVPRRAYATSAEVLRNGNGPDLAFIRLPNGSDSLAHMKATKSFVVLDSRAESKFQEASAENGALVFAGFPEQFRKPNRMVGPGAVLFDFPLTCCNAATKRTYCRKGWDYADIEIDLARIPQLRDQPKTFEGVSGGGCWRLVPEAIREEPTGYRIRPVLAGVAFREIRPGHGCVVRAHGPKSVYRRLLPLIAELDS
jgi:hypothetical protein